MLISSGSLDYLWISFWPSTRESLVLSNVLVNVSLILALGLFISLAARRSSANFKHSVLATALILTLTIPVLSSVVPGWQFPKLKTVERDSSVHRLVATNLPTKEFQSANDRLLGQQNIDESTNARQGKLAADGNSRGVAQLGRNNHLEKESESKGAKVFLPSRRMPWLTIWAIGSLLAAIPLLAGVLFRRSLLANSVLVTDQATLKLAKRLHTQLAGHAVSWRTVRLFVVEREVIPVTWGCLRPVILLPASSRDWSEQRRQSVLLHELSHICRFDFPVQILARSACACFWFHPLAWIVFHRMKIEQEYACDNCVVGAGQKPTVYATELVGIAESYRNESSRDLGLAMSRDTKLKTRVELLFDHRRSHRPVSRFVMATLVGFLASATVLMVGYRGFAKTQQEDKPTARVDSLGDPLPDGALMRFGSSRFQHPKIANAVAVSNDHKTVVSINRDFVIGWDSKSGKQLWKKESQLEAVGSNRHVQFSAASYGTHPIAFIPESNKFYFPAGDSSISIWDATTGDRRELKLDIGDVDWNHKSAFRSIAVSPEGDQIALGNADSMILCDSNGKVQYAISNNPSEDIQQAKEPHTRGGGMVGSDRMGFGGEFSYVRFVPDDDRLALVNSEAPKHIRLLEIATGEEVGKIETQHRVVRMDFTPFGDRVIVTERDSSVRMYDLSTGELVWSTEFEIEANAENYTTDVVVDPNGKYAAVGAPLGSQSHIRVVSVSSGEEIAILKGHTWRPWSLSLTSDGSRMYSTGWDGSILQWDMKTFRQIPMTEGERATGISCASPVDNRVAYITRKGKIKIADSTTGKTLLEIDAKDFGQEKISFSPDGTLIAAGGMNEKFTLLGVWNVDTGKQIHLWRWGKGRDPHSHITGLSFSPDGTKIAASVFRQNKAYVFSLTAGEQISEIQHPMVYGCSFDAKGSRLTTVGWDSAIRSWAVESGSPIPNGKIEMARMGAGGGRAGDNRTYGIRYSPDQVHFATLQMGAVTKIWRIGQDKPIAATTPSGGVATGCMAYSLDGSLLATGDRFGNVKIMDALTAQVILEKQAHVDNTYSLNFSADGKTLLSGGSDGVSYIWSLRPELGEQKTVANLFEQLTGDDMTAAYQARWALVEKPDETLRFLENKLLSHSGNESKTAVDLGDASLRVLAVIQAIDTKESKELLQSICSQAPNSFIGTQAKRLLDSGK